MHRIMEQHSGRFPLHDAARLGNVDQAEQLLKADAALSTCVDDDGRFPIHWAASSNSFDMVLLLASQPGFDPDVQDAAGWTPLIISASVPDSEPVLRLLLDRGADVNRKSKPPPSPPRPSQNKSRWANNVPDGNGQTALHLVASKKNVDVARFLLDLKPPASTCVRDGRRRHPIHRAAAAGSVPMVNLLLKNRSPLNPTDNDGYTPLHHAIAEGHGDAAVALLKEGADFTIRNSRDELALHLAPDKEVRRYIMQGAEREGIDLSASY